MLRRAAIVAAGALLASCGGGDKAEQPLPKAPERLSLSSPAFRDGARIPKRYTCDGADASPPLRWSGVPGGARALDVAPFARGVAEGEVPQGGEETENSFGKMGYGGPCPPDDDPAHTYEFVLYALRNPLRAGGDATPDDVRSRLRTSALARGSLTGRFR